VESSILTRRSYLLLALLLGLTVFLLNHAAVISGALYPPAGYEPAWVLRNMDTPQYLTWLNAAQSEILLQDYHAPWRTEQALWQPLMLLAARTGLSPLQGYYALHLILYLLTAGALLYAARVFCPGRQMWFALGVAACAIPLRLLAWAMSTGAPLRWRAIFMPGLLDYGYETADGFFRGGSSTSPTLTTGTLSMLLAMALLTRYLDTSKRWFLAALCSVAFLSALLHPFEIFVIVAASAVPLLLARKLGSWFLVGISGFAGMLPYIVTGALTEWLRDSSESIRAFYHPVWTLMNFGLPCFLTVQLLLMRFRMPLQGDMVLRSWFIAAPLLAMVPGIPVPIHLLDGFAYCIGFLLIRRIASHPKLPGQIQQSPRMARFAFAALMATGVISLGVNYLQVWSDGYRKDGLLVNTIRQTDERRLLEWLTVHSDRSTLILSPMELAPWVTTIPRHSFASHDVSSLTYNHQTDTLERFLRAEPGSEKVLDEYGVGIAVLPASSPANAQMRPENWRTDIGLWKVYEFPGASMRPYPGRAALDPSATFSAGHKALELLGAALHAGPSGPRSR
jgi:hypothetical protein